MSIKLFLCTDLDRTLLPNGIERESRNVRKYFSRFVSSDNVQLAYVTGRHRQLVQRAIKNFCLPSPNFAITDVGTKIYHVNGAQWDVMEKWERLIEKDWAGMTHAQLRHLFRDITQLQIQETSKQNTHKLSYYVPLHVDSEELISEMDARLQAHGVNASLVYSVDAPAGIGLLDVLPKEATKLHAITFIAEELNYSLEEIIFAGDSGNDLPVLASTIPSVLVANASDDVKKTAEQQARDAGNRDELYLANGNYRDMNGNYAAGILEGIVHFRPELEKQIQACIKS